jgi:hypothetical protein
MIDIWALTTTALFVIWVIGMVIVFGSTIERMIGAPYHIWMWFTAFVLFWPAWFFVSTMHDVFGWAKKKLDI